VKSKKIIFFGNWGPGDKALRKLLQAGFEISGVVTQHDEEKEPTDGYYNIVYNTARENCIPIFNDCNELINEGPDTADHTGVSVAYNRIFRGDILDKLRIVNFHPSRLPDYRGPSPVEWQIKDGCCSIGMTAHYVDSGIDTGMIINRSEHSVDDRKSYRDFLVEFNGRFSDFVVETVKNIESLVTPHTGQAGKSGYYPRLLTPDAVREGSVADMREVLNRNRIAFFTGNRAEFGLLFPLILELSGEFLIDIFVSGAHLIEPWKSIGEVRDKVSQYGLAVNITPIHIEAEDDYYRHSLPCIYGFMLKHFTRYEKRVPYRFSVILGDRIETLGFALASFYSKVPVIHLCGGDVANVPYFDTSVRHSISKLSHLHFTTNELSKKVLEQMGEEEQRIYVTGNPSYDYDRMGLLPAADELRNEFGIDENEFVLLCTYHASPFKTDEENLTDFRKLFEVLTEIRNTKAIITYPNNDPGSGSMISFLDEKRKCTDMSLRIVTSLGTEKYLALLKHFKTIVIGNSSSALTETAFYSVPAINIGDRQTDRFRGVNVFDCGTNADDIRALIYRITDTYSHLKENFISTKYFFGDGNAAPAAKKIIDSLSGVPKEKMLLKKFVIRNRDAGSHSGDLRLHEAAGNTAGGL
jgi:UDP-hydrolysing UDP-N-acetyl-D-glucosamine 2-epimerase